MHQKKNDNHQSSHGREGLWVHSPLAAICFLFPLFFFAASLHAAEGLESIHLSVRVFRFQSDEDTRLNCSLSDKEIREQFVAVNDTWKQASIVWEIESIREMKAKKPDLFSRAMMNPRGQLAAALVQNLQDDHLLVGGFNVVIAEDFEKSIGGVFIPQADGIVFYAKRGPKGIQTPAVLAHELGHALGLPHTIFEKGNNLMMGSGPERVPTRVKPVTASQIAIARQYAEVGKPFKPQTLKAPKGNPAEVFHFLDSDSNGVLTVDESPTEYRDYAKEFFRKASRSPNDEINRQDYSKIVRQRSSGSRRVGYGPEIIPQILTRFDSDQNGILSRAEVKNPSSVVFRFFKQWDLDGDQQLTRKEMEESLKRSRAQPPAN
ncbi:hypothetical protein OAH34_01480 [bacterium]|nr:hypothetical protein [bacterium]